MKITGVCVMCTEKHVLIKKGVTNGLNKNLILEETDHGLETHWLSAKEKILGTEVSKEGQADNILKHERPHHYWLLWKRCNHKWCFLLQHTLSNMSSYLLNDPFITTLNLTLHCTCLLKSQISKLLINLYKFFHLTFKIYRAEVCSVVVTGLGNGHGNLIPYKHN